MTEENASRNPATLATAAILWALTAGAALAAPFEPKRVAAQPGMDKCDGISLAGKNDRKAGAGTSRGGSRADYQADQVPTEVAIDPE